MAGLRVSAGAHGSGEKRYHYLDAAQLVKHAFGLGRTFGGQEVTLVYVYLDYARVTVGLAEENDAFLKAAS